MSTTGSAACVIPYSTQRKCFWEMHSMAGHTMLQHSTAQQRTMQGRVANFLQTKAVCQPVEEVARWLWQPVVFQSAQHSTAQHSTAQHSTAQHSTAGTAQCGTHLTEASSSMAVIGSRKLVTSAMCTPSSRLPLGSSRTCSASSMSLQPGGSTLQMGRCLKSSLQSVRGGIRIHTKGKGRCSQIMDGRLDVSAGCYGSLPRRLGPQYRLTETETLPEARQEDGQGAM